MDNKRIVEIKLRSVAAQAESLAEDVRNNKLWEGDLSRRIGLICSEARDAANEASKDRR